MAEQKEIEVQDGRGIMFEVKGRTEKSPNMRGAFRAKTDIAAGEKIDLAGWFKETRNGNFMVSFAQQTEEWKAQRPPSQGYNDADGNYRRREPDAIAFNGDTDPDIPY